MLYLDEDESFSLMVNVTNTGYQRVALKGFLVRRESNGTYIAPLLPQLFYGAGDQQLQTWRQNLTSTGSQVILSRSGGLPTLPKQELYWRKVGDSRTTQQPQAVTQEVGIIASPLIPIIIGGGILLTLGYLIFKK